MCHNRHILLLLGDFILLMLFYPIYPAVGHPLMQTEKCPVYLSDKPVSMPLGLSVMTTQRIICGRRKNKKGCACAHPFIYYLIAWRQASRAILPRMVSRGVNSPFTQKQRWLKYDSWRGQPPLFQSGQQYLSISRASPPLWPGDHVSVPLNGV